MKKILINKQIYLGGKDLDDEIIKIDTQKNSLIKTKLVLVKDL